MIEKIYECSAQTSTNKVFYIDYENVGSSGLEGITELKSSDKVFVYYGNDHATMTLDAHMNISLSNCKMIFKLIQMPVKNAIDCKTLFDIEEEIAKIKPIEICIVSKDNDYDKAIEMFNSVTGVKISRAVTINEYFHPSTILTEIVEKSTSTDRKTLITDFCNENLKSPSVDDRKEEIIQIMISSKTKVDVNNKLSKLLRDSKKASEIYKLLNPFVVALPSN